MHVFHTAPLIMDTFEQAREASQCVCVQYEEVITSAIEGSI